MMVCHWVRLESRADGWLGAGMACRCMIEAPVGALYADRVSTSSGFVNDNHYHLLWAE
ncbi:hypothetical protein PT2222_20440 [Paraburkholderia tropica]